MSPEKLQDVSLMQIFPHPTRWEDNGLRKPHVQHPHCNEKELMVALWLTNRPMHGLVDFQMATRDGGMNMTLESRPTSVQGHGALAVQVGYFDLSTCRKICDEGRISDAVDALAQLLQRRCHAPNNLFYRVLKRCIKAKDLGLGRRIHALADKCGYEGDPFLATHLIGLYASQGQLEEAKQVFVKVSKPDVYNWATIIFAYARHGDAAEAAEAIRLFRQMCQSTVIKPDDRIYSAVLKACAAARDLAAGKEVHAHILASPKKPDVFVEAGLVSMYAKCGSLQDARKLFDELSIKDVVACNAMLAGYAQQGMGKEALSFYRSIQKEVLARPDSVTYVCLLQACASVGSGALSEGQRLHALIEDRGLHNDVVLGGSLVNMYAKCGSLEEGRKVFDRLSTKNIVAWNAILAGYAQQDMGEEALRLYRSMPLDGLSPDCVTYVCLLQACANVGIQALREGKQLHAEIEQRSLHEDVVLGSSLVNMYAKCGSVENARRVFNKLPQRNVVAWTSMFAGYAKQGMGSEALSLYRSMLNEGLNSPDCVTYVCLLQACASVGIGALHEGKMLHVGIKEQGFQDDVVLGGSLVNMYAKCGSLEAAREVFDGLPARNVAAWNAILAGYAQQGLGQEVLSLYESMQQEGLAGDSVTYVYLLQACASEGVAALDQGKKLHAQIGEGLRMDMVLGASLVNMYTKCGSLEDACSVFNKISQRNVVLYNAMLAGYAQQGMGEEALNLYRSMELDGLIPDSVTYICLLQACASVAALPLGEQFHAQIKERGMQADGGVGAAIVNMYAKCGSMSDSQRVFDSLGERTMEAWNALIGGYTRQGDSQVVFDLLDKMEEEGSHPDEITFLSVLTVCSHVGLVEKGRKYFEQMRGNSGINATMEHFVCMVDLLGRAGHLDEALQVAKTMPFPPNDIVWHTLLGACLKWKNVAIGKQAFKSAVDMDEKDGASYVLMSNIYATANMWEAAKEMQARRKQLGAWKKPGQSWWTDMGGVVHSFLVGDKKHAESKGIYTRLEQLIPKIKKAGYVPHLASSLLYVSDDEKETELCGHSEKLVIAYALNKTPEGTTIRIVKNLRVCEDCHTATAYISEVERRTIICRDASRFHVFKEGKCSCGDYW